MRRREKREEDKREKREGEEGEEGGGQRGTGWAHDKTNQASTTINKDTLHQKWGWARHEEGATEEEQATTRRSSIDDKEERQGGAAASTITIASMAWYWMGWHLR